MAARVPISAADVARLLEAMGVDRVVAVDLHCGQIQGFFGPRVPVDNLQGGVVGVDYFAQMDLQKPVIVSPDAGGVYRVKKFRDGMMTKHGIDAGVAMIIKQRGKPGQIDSMDLVSAVVSWNIDSGDWLLNGADEQVSTVLDSMTPGNIVLLTDSDECAEQTLEALPQIIDGLVADGYKIVTLSDLVKTDTALSKKLTSLTKVSMPKNAVFPQLPEDDDTTE